MKLDQKSIEFEVKASTAKANEIEGYASTFDLKPDACGDIVKKGAFAKTIKERGDRIFLLYNHDWNKVLGRVTHLQEDSTGLYFKAEITETTLGKDVMALIRSKVLTKLSIGYRTEKSRFDTLKRARVLEEVTLFEVSVVTLPANDNANLTRFKSDLSVVVDKADALFKEYFEHKKRKPEQSDSLTALENLLKAYKNK